VNGKKADPAYKFMRKESQLKGKEITWNYAKFLINKRGKVVSYYDPDTSPNKIKPDIMKLLN